MCAVPTSGIGFDIVQHQIEFWHWISLYLDLIRYEHPFSLDPNIVGFCWIENIEQSNLFWISNLSS